MVILTTVLDRLARFCSLYAGLVMIGIAGMTVWSVIGRDFFGAALLGDFELVQVGMACAVAAFMPLCQLRRSNIIVDFFTLKASARSRQMLDRIGALALAAMMILLAWRTAIGAADAWRYGTASMMMQFPEWIAYASIVPPLLLTAAIAIVQAAAPNAFEPKVAGSPMADGTR